jgi:hypothetical protein
MTPEQQADEDVATIRVQLAAAVGSIQRCLSLQREPQHVRDAVEMVRWLAVHDREKFDVITAAAAAHVAAARHG